MKLHPPVFQHIVHRSGIRPALPRCQGTLRSSTEHRRPRRQRLWSAPAPKSLKVNGFIISWRTTTNVGKPLHHLFMVIFGMVYGIGLTTDENTAKTLPWSVHRSPRQCHRAHE